MGKRQGREEEIEWRIENGKSNKYTSIQITNNK